MIRSITILGSASGRNAGDAALIAGIMDSIDSTLGRRVTYEIPTINPEFVRRTYHNQVEPIGMMPWHLSLKMLGVPTLRSVLRTDLTLVFDAVLFDRALYNPLFNFLSTLYLILPYAKKRGAKIGLFNIGAGPVDTDTGKHMLRTLADISDFITVRDGASEKLLRDIGVVNPRLRLAADSAISLEPAPPERVQSILSQYGITAEEEFLAININSYLDTWARPKRPSVGKEKFLRIYADAITAFLQQVNVPVVFVSTQHHDVPITKELMSLIPHPSTALISNTEYSPYEIKGVFSRAALHFGMRLHATILSASALAPTIGIAYQPKVGFFFERLGLPELCIDFSNFTAEALRDHLLHSWQRRHEIKAHLQREIPLLHHSACSSAELVKAIDCEEELDRHFPQHDLPAYRLESKRQNG